MTFAELKGYPARHRKETDYGQLTAVIVLIMFFWVLFFGAFSPLQTSINLTTTIIGGNTYEAS